MRVRRSKGRITGYIQRYLPRFLAIAWAAWAAATAAAYLDLVPRQLAMVDSAVGTPVWLMWAVAAVALFLGVLVPSTASATAHDVARWSRIGGMMIIIAELVVWTVAFFAESPRGWVSGKNYLMLMIMAMYTTWTIARDRAGGKRVMPRGD